MGLTERQIKRLMRLHNDDLQKASRKAGTPRNPDEPLYIGTYQNDMWVAVNFEFQGTEDEKIETYVKEVIGKIVKKDFEIGLHRHTHGWVTAVVRIPK